MILINAEDLDNQDDMNTVAADVKYKGRLLQVHSTCGKLHIERNSAMVKLFTDNGEEAIDCEFTPETAQQLKTLQMKQTLEIRGRCGGRSDVTGTLADCEFSKVGK